MSDANQGEWRMCIYIRLSWSMDLASGIKESMGYINIYIYNGDDEVRSVYILYDDAKEWKNEWTDPPQQEAVFTICAEAISVNHRIITTTQLSDTEIRARTHIHKNIYINIEHIHI